MVSSSLSKATKDISVASVGRLGACAIIGISSWKLSALNKEDNTMSKVVYKTRVCPTCGTEIGHVGAKKSGTKIEIYDNMRMPDASKICPRCGGEQWQHANQMVECVKCGLWGWLPRK